MTPEHDAAGRPVSPTFAAEPRPEASAPTVYLHIGMPKTASTSLQHVLSTGAEALRERGYLYPAQWTRGVPPGHHALTEAVSGDPSAMLDIARELRQYLSQHPARHVVLSAEGLAEALLRDRARATLGAFLTRCAATAELEVVIAIRRLDEFLHSAFLQATKAGRAGQALTAEEFVSARGRRWVENLFPGIEWLRESAPGRLTILPYHEGEDLLAELLQALGLRGLQEAVTDRPAQANRRFGLKAQAVMLLPDAALRVLGMRQRQHLYDLFGSGQFEFGDEVYDYDVFGYDLRQEIHSRALARAAECGIHEYTTAFAHAAVPHMAAVDLDTSLLSSADFYELHEALKGQRKQARAAVTGAETGI